MLPKPEHTQNLTEKGRGILLEDLTWQEAEDVLRPDTIIVVPIGAAAKEHGPHLQLKTDWLLAEYFKREILNRSEVVVAPTVNYHYYPAFVEYPGSVTLRLETARDLIADICGSLARHGPRKFYALNTGVSTVMPLELTAQVLAANGIRFHYTDILKLIRDVEAELKQEEGGIETSMMLYIARSTVDMSKAVKEYHPSQETGLTRDPKGAGAYSASGIYGDATLATWEKGRTLVRAIVNGILGEIQELRIAR
jgi:creatinine amidohydrolase